LRGRFRPRRRRCRRRAKFPLPIAQHEHAGLGPFPQEEVRVAVLVDVGGRHRRVICPGRHPELRRRIAERAVPHVPEQRGRQSVARDEDVDVPPVVEIGCDNRVASPGRPLRAKAGGGRDVGERGVAIVAQQLRGGAGRHDVEVAVVIHVRERSG
jgi:hypothetical protein